MIKFGSLFDGAGTVPFAAQLCGAEAVWASEIEPFPIAVTKKRFPNMKHLGDITKINGADIEPVDVISFGSPCQDLSIAGKRVGLEGERSGLFMEAVRIIKEMREKTNGRFPTVAIWENVPGAFSSNRGEDFRVVLEEMCRVKDSSATIPRPPQGGGGTVWADAGSILADGYSVAWRVLDAQYWGVPQRRRRIFLVADFAGQRAEEILFKSDGLQRNFAENRKSWQGITDGAEGSVGTTSGIEYLPVENHAQDGRFKICSDKKMPTLNQHMGTGGNNVPLVMKVRCGRAGGGKGALIRKDQSLTISTHNDQALFIPAAFVKSSRARSTADVSTWKKAEIANTLNTFDTGEKRCNELVVYQKVYGICSYESNSMRSKNPHSGIYEAETARTLDENGGNPTCNQGGIVVVGFDAKNVLVTYEKAKTILAGRNDKHSIPTIFIKRKRGSLRRRRYYVRRLTPTECGRLQGMPDWWCSDVEHSDAAEYKMWGNGMALPNILYVVENTVRVLRERYEQYL